MRTRPSSLRLTVELRPAQLKGVHCSLTGVPLLLISWDKGLRGKRAVPSTSGSHGPSLPLLGPSYPGIYIYF